MILVGFPTRRRYLTCFERRIVWIYFSYFDPLSPMEKFGSKNSGSCTIIVKKKRWWRSGPRLRSVWPLSGIIWSGRVRASRLKIRRPDEEGQEDRTLGKRAIFLTRTSDNATFEPYIDRSTSQTRTLAVVPLLERFVFYRTSKFGSYHPSTYSLCICIHKRYNRTAEDSETLTSDLSTKQVGNLANGHLVINYSVAAHFGHPAWTGLSYRLRSFF